MVYDPTKLVYAGTLQKAPRTRSGSEELVDDMGKMAVDSESKDKKEEEKVDEDIKKKHYELIRRLRKVVQELILEREKGEGKKEIGASPQPVAAH